MDERKNRKMPRIERKDKAEKYKRGFFIRLSDIGGSEFIDDHKVGPCIRHSKEYTKRGPRIRTPKGDPEKGQQRWTAKEFYKEGPQRRTIKAEDQIGPQRRPTRPWGARKYSSIRDITFAHVIVRQFFS